MMVATWGVVVLWWTTSVAVRLLGASFLEKVDVWANWLTGVPSVRLRELSLDVFLRRPTRKLLTSSLVGRRPVGKTLLHGVVMLPREAICAGVNRFAVPSAGNWSHGIHRPMLVVHIKVRRLVYRIVFGWKLFIHVRLIIIAVLIGKVLRLLPLNLIATGLMILLTII